MIKSIEINGFKRFEHIQIKDFGRINLFVGRNNVGKTTLLEAILAFCCGKSFLPFAHMAILHRRHDMMSLASNAVSSAYSFSDMILQSFMMKKNPQSLDFSFAAKVDDESHTVEHLFSPGEIFEEFFPKHMGGLGNSEPSIIDVPNIQMQSGNGFSIQLRRQVIGTWKIMVDNEEVSYQIAVPDIAEEKNQRPLLMARFNDILSHRIERDNRRIYSQMSRENEIDNFVDELNQSFRNLKIEKIENIPFPDGSEAPISFLMSNGEHIPLYAMGDGVRRWYTVLGGMSSFRNAVHCFEEIDSGFHHEAQEQLSKNLFNYANVYNNQLFMTTHNIEYMDTLLEAAKKRGGDCLTKEVRIITLRQDEKGITHRIMDGEEALWARKNGLELRR